ncbi:MAG: FtsX-like permease family protein [Candidatus Altiarchaeales archaeon]|nr:FtsX-like permease family protein [Candidatus Altiarchaeales archaeon]MBD3416438.1 FtsX-like permease family protein [Candidatus Altiarchaeales archaeon]
MLDIAFKNVFRQKSRSILTMLGIAMGIGLILTLGAIGEGLNKQIQDSFGDMAAVIDVRDFESEDGITEDMIQDIRDITGVTDVVAIGEYRISRGGHRGFGGMMGRMMGGSSSTLEFTALNPEDQDYLIGENIVADDGRKLDVSDDFQYVVLLGSTTAYNQLYNVGDEIEYQRVENDTTDSFHFEVVGILEETGDSTIDEAAFVPLSTMQDLEDDDKITQLKVKVDEVENVEPIQQEISDMFDTVRAFSAITLVRSLESTLGTITMAVYGIGAVSIIVGGIGIMNTMIMSVMERRREIGVMKAIGATTTNILMQVLEESAVLSLIGGFIGFMLGYGASELVKSHTSFTPILSPELIAIGFAFSLILGMGAGLYPAWAASRLDPIEVLRYE